MSYVLTSNATAFVRSGNIWIADRYFPVTQLAGFTNPPTCTFSILPGSRTHGYGSVSNTVFVTTQFGCAWSVVNTNPWVYIVSSPTNSGAGTVNYSLAPNTGPEPRSGNVLLGGQLFRLTQSGNSQRLQLVLRTVTNATFSVQGEAGKMYVVQASDDLIHWIPISTNSALSTVTAAPAGSEPRRFYRTVQIP